MANYIINENKKHKSIEITFEGKPVEAVRTLLKQNHFRWNRKKSLWYGFMDKAEMAKLLGNKVKYEKPAEKTETKKSVKSAKKGTADIIDLFDDAIASDEVEYILATPSGFITSKGKMDMDSGCVIEKRGEGWIATDYLSGMRVAKETTKKALMDKLAALKDKLEATRSTEKYQQMVEKAQKEVA